MVPGEKHPCLSGWAVRNDILDEDAGSRSVDLVVNLTADDRDTWRKKPSKRDKSYLIPKFHRFNSLQALTSFTRFLAVGAFLKKCRF